MRAPDGTIFIVNNTNIQKPAIKEASNPVVDGLKVVLQSTPASVLSGGWAAKEVIGNVGGTIINNGDSGSISSNSNNPINIGDTDNSGTATPTIVNRQVVEPTVVDKQVVDPVIIKSE